MKIHTPHNIGQVLQKVWDSGFITEGEYSDRFEVMFGDFVNNPNVALVNSCTSALTLASHMCDLRPGDEVITTAMTCMATNIPFYNHGAKLVFADVDPRTGNISVDSIIDKINNRTKAIVMVHWAGLPCDLKPINDLARKHGIKTIEDAAHALRSTYHNKLIGNHSDYVCFSFQAVKHMTTADGGAIVCRTIEDVERIRKLRWFGLDRHHTAPVGEPPASRWEQDIPEVGYKMHMNNINAVIGIEQLKYINALIDLHISNGEYYDHHIDNPHIMKLDRPKDRQSTYWIYTVLVENRKHFKEYLAKNDIASDVAHVRNDTYSVFEKFRTDGLVGLDEFDSKQLNIPVGWWVNNNDREYIVSIINNYGGDVT
jgi:dTDP-4-amino-4,6-dideoxygalactose transaminase